uniref:Cleavage/polyadenylation specificity factor A subunit C-terminal domain-containing protein n=1 Tax=Ditylenchus dipsaci TaxID=166011 RepID=A0A915DD69_9BILA
MASLLVDSEVLDKHKTQHIIGVTDQQLYLAADVPSKYVFDEINSLHAEELEVLFCVPFEVDSWCSTQCIDRTSSLAIYHLAEDHIYAFANGYFDSESTISLSVLRISLLSGEYTRFQLASLDGDSYGVVDGKSAAIVGEVN